MSYPRSILFLEKFDFANLTRLQQFGFQLIEEYRAETLDHSDVCAIFTKVSKKLPKEFMRRFPNLAFVVIPATGTDLVEISDKEIQNFEVISLRDNPDILQKFHSTREVFLWLLISLLRNTYQGAKDVELSRNWDRDKHIGTNLYGKKIGILGYGRIGSQIAETCNALGMQVYAWDISKKSKINPGVHFVSSPESLVSSVEVLSINIDSRPENVSYINQDLLSLGKDLYLINTARGFVVDESSVLSCLANGTLLGYGADVLVGEGSDGQWLEQNIIWKAMVSMNHYNIVLTPHLGGATHENIHQAESAVIDVFLKRVMSVD